MYVGICTYVCLYVCSNLTVHISMCTFDQIRLPSKVCVCVCVCVHVITLYIMYGSTHNTTCTYIHVYAYM